MNRPTLLAALLATTSGYAEEAPPPPPSPPADGKPAGISPPAVTAPALKAPEPASSAPKPLGLSPAEPLAGYANGNFFLRDPNDWFVVLPKARLHVDVYTFLNRDAAPEGVEPNSSADPRPRDTIFIRRGRVGVQGTFFRHIDYQIEGEFSSTVTNGQYGLLADCFVIVDYLDFLKLQVGNFNLPFTIENRTSNKIFDFAERSVLVRAFAVPSNKDIGAQLFGWLPKNVAYYSLAVTNGAYQQNLRNQDNNFAVFGRAFIAPLAPWAGDRAWMRELSIGGGGWWQRDNNLGGLAGANASGAAQDDLPAMTTQAGVTFFNTSYGNGKDAAGNSIRSHLVPDGTTTKWAVEANLPYRRFGLRFEMVGQHIGLGRFDDVNPANAQLKRSANHGASLDGLGLYVEAFAWVLGDSSIIGPLGISSAPRVKPWKTVSEPKWGLMLAAKYEYLKFDVTGLPVDSSGAADPAQGTYRLDVFELGANAWGTKHIRLTANYVLNYLTGSAPQAQKNFFYQRPEHELVFRFAVTI